MTLDPGMSPRWRTAAMLVTWRPVTGLPAPVGSKVKFTIACPLVRALIAVICPGA